MLTIVLLFSLVLAYSNLLLWLFLLLISWNYFVVFQKFIFIRNICHIISTIFCYFNSRYSYYTRSLLIYLMTCLFWLFLRLFCTIIHVSRCFVVCFCISFLHLVFRLHSIIVVDFLLILTLFYGTVSLILYFPIFLLL